MNIDKILSMFDLVDEFQLIDFSPASTATLNLTKTMLDKCIIDANASIRQLARLFDVDYDELMPSEKVKVPSLLCNGTEATVTFYKTARGDRRISIQNIKEIAGAGDTLDLTWGKSEAGELILIVKQK
tara:strand:- start:2698 stop:3081 length:384 start_codon:yes stop_codon:yes gene_type:complete